MATNLAAARLELGWITRQSGASGSRGAWRGEGFELATDAWTTVRASEGLLLTTQARPQGASTQLDASEALARVKGAKQLVETLAQHASTHSAGTLQAAQDKQPLPELVKTLEACHSGPQGGQSEKIHAAGSRSETEAAHKLEKPIIAFDSAASLIATTPASLQLMSGESASLTAYGDTHLAAGQSASFTAGQDLASAVGDGSNMTSKCFGEFDGHLEPSSAASKEKPASLALGGLRLGSHDREACLRQESKNPAEPFRSMGGGE